MADLAGLQKQRAELIKEIQRRGGKAKAPNFTKQLEALEGQIRTAKGGAAGGAVGQNPPGSSTSQDTAVTQKDPFDSATGQTKKDLNIGKEVGGYNQAGSILGQNANINGPLGNQKVEIDPDTNQATVTNTLNADQQSILDSGSKLTQMGQDLAKQQLSGYQSYKADTSAMNGGYKADTSGMGAYSFDSSEAGRQRIEEAAFKRLSRGMDQRQTADKENLAQSLYNRGIQFSNDPNSRYQQEMQAQQQSQQDERQSYEQRAVEMGGQEMSRNYDISSGTYGTNLTGNQARNSATLTEQQQRISEQQAANSANLTEQQQYMNDVSQLGQSTGTGLQLPNFPTYQGAGMDVTQGANVALSQQAQNSNAKQTDAAIEALKRKNSGGGASSSGSDNGGAFIA